MAEQFGVATFVAVGIGALSTILTYLASRRPSQADYAERLLNATVPATEMLGKRLAALELDLAKSVERYERLEAKSYEETLRCGELERRFTALVDHLKNVNVPMPESLTNYRRQARTRETDFNEES